MTIVISCTISVEPQVIVKRSEGRVAPLALGTVQYYHSNQKQRGSNYDHASPDRTFV